MVLKIKFLVTFNLTSHDFSVGVLTNGRDSDRSPVVDVRVPVRGTHGLEPRRRKHQGKWLTIVQQLVPLYFS